MKEEEVIHAAFVAWNEGGFNAFLEYLAPDVEWHAPPGYPEGDVWHRRETLAKDWRAQFDSVFSESSFELAEITRTPHGWFLAIRSAARSAQSGMDLEWKSFFVCHLEESKFKQVRLFFDRAEARQAAGLDPT